jgi:transketolase
MDLKNIEKLCRLIRHDILTATTMAGSGHPTSSLSAVELMTTLFFGGFYHFDLKRPDSVANDRFILSKGHASPLLYSLYHAAGALDYKKLLTLRKLGSILEGHPNPRLSFVNVATGSLGQGLSNGLGMAMAINLKIFKQELNIARIPKVWVLLGDSEMAEGQVWEAIEVASFYAVSNLIGIIDVNRLGQNSETASGWDIYGYQKKLEAFGWKTIVIDNAHNLKEVQNAFYETENKRTVKDQRPTMIIARTVKGKGVSFLENKENWHGKSLDDKELEKAIKELGSVDLNIKGRIVRPKPLPATDQKQTDGKMRGLLSRLSVYSLSHNPLTEIPTREAYGDALAELGRRNQKVVVLDAEVANSTYQNKFQKLFPERFFEMFIAEENMMGVAVGLSKMGYIPFVSTFAAFLTQTFDQIRMAQYSKANLKIVGSHAGVSIGEDGPSQMGLEDIAMMRSILESIVLYPSDATSARKLTELMAKNDGIYYLRTTRGKTPVIYDDKEEFEIGGFKIHDSKKTTGKSKALIIAAGITLHEALKAQGILEKNSIKTTVIDLYSIKPLDGDSLVRLAKKSGKVIVVEDHYPAGGIGEAIAMTGIKFTHLCVRKTPMSGKPHELLRYEEIDSVAIVNAVKED